MARSDLVGAVSEIAVLVAEQVFPALPVEAAVEALGVAFKRPVEEITDEELQSFLKDSLLRQRANLG